MLKNSIYVLMIVVFLVLTSCSSAEPEQLLNVDEKTSVEISKFIESYKLTMIEAVNTGDFNKLEPYLITNNSFYHSLRRYASELHSEKKTKDLVSLQVHKVYESELGEYFADASEVVLLHDQSKDEKIEREIQYEIIRGGDDSLRIVTIKQLK